MIAFGVLLDTFIVRSVLVPALVLDIGPKVWWPSQLARTDGARAARPGRRAGEPTATAMDNGRVPTGERSAARDVRWAAISAIDDVLGLHPDGPASRRNSASSRRGRAGGAHTLPALLGGMEANAQDPATPPWLRERHLRA